MGSSHLDVIAAYKAAFDRLEADRDGEPGAVRDARRSAWQAFASRGLPTRRDEDWRHTEIGPITERAFVPLDGASHIGAEAQGEFATPDREHQLVLVDGRLARDPLAPAPAVGDLFAGSLADGLATQPDVVAAHFRERTPSDETPFAALNAALAADGALVLVPEQCRVERAIAITSVVSPSAGGRAAFPRNVLVIGADSDVTIVESYVGDAATAYLSCPVTEIVVGPRARLRHYRWQEEGAAAHHVGLLRASVAAGASFTSHSIALGAATARLDAQVDLAGEGGECALYGLYLAAGRQCTDTHMVVRHVEPRCTSTELFKGILDDRARAVFHGRIYVHPGAQQTDARQSNRNLLLSREALVNSNPQLEIFADDVKCTHGSTVGQMDDDALFYLRARGVDIDAARSLLVYAFAGEILDGIALSAVRHRLESRLADRLPRGDVIREIGALGGLIVGVDED